jgi:hypothetical protein
VRPSRVSPQMKPEAGDDDVKAQSRNGGYPIDAETDWPQRQQQENGDDALKTHQTYE